MNTNKWIGVGLAIVLIGVSHDIRAAGMHENTLKKRKILSSNIRGGDDARDNLSDQNESPKKSVRFADEPEHAFKKNSPIVSPKKKQRKTKKVVQSQPARNISFLYCWACRCS